MLGVGMGLIVSQLGNVVQSSVDASGRGEAGGLQFTGQQLGSSLGVALIGAIVLIGLGGAFVSNIQDDPAIADDDRDPARDGRRPGDRLRARRPGRGASCRTPGVDDATTAVIVDDYEDASLKALKVGLLAAAFLALFSLAFTGDLPHDPVSRDEGSPRRRPRARPGMSESRRGRAPEPSAPVPSPDPIELLRSRQYLGLLVFGALIGVPVAAIAFGFLKLVDVGEEWAFSTCPTPWASAPRRSGGPSPSWWWPG